MADILNSCDPDGARIVAEACAAVPRAAGDAIRPCTRGKPDAMTFLTGAFGLAAQKIAEQADPHFMQAPCGMLRRRLGLWTTTRSPLRGRVPRFEPCRTASDKRRPATSFSMPPGAARDR